MKAFCIRGLVFAGVTGLLVFAVPIIATADPMPTLTPGAYVSMIRDYDFETDSFTNAPAKGEGDACFQITAVDDQGVHMTLIAGLYHPWWSDAVIPPGATDVWSNSPGYLENRPDAAPLDLIRQIFTTVDSCPIG